jgi:serine/threonine protein kinase
MLSNSFQNTSGIISMNTQSQPNIEFSNITPICITENHYFFTFKAQRHFKWFVIKQLNPKYNNVFPYNTLLFKEFELLNQMEHPCIVRTYGWEKVNNIDSLIIEYVDGLTLQEHIEQHDLKSSELHKIVLELASAIGYIHSKQVLHRDIKPENVMITRIGKHLKLIDFGLSDSDAHALLKSAVGTQMYCSPEQKNGDIIDERTDIYSFGVLLGEIHKVVTKWHLLQRRVYSIVANKCTNLLIEDRYKDMNEVIRAIKIQTTTNFGLLIIFFSLLFGVTYFSLGSHFISNSIKRRPLKHVVVWDNSKPQLVVANTTKHLKKTVKRVVELPKPILKPNLELSFEIKAQIIGSTLCADYLKKYPNEAKTQEEILAAAYFFDSLRVLTFEKKDALFNSIPDNYELRTKCLNAFNAEMFDCMQVYGKLYSNALKNGAMGKHNLK